MQTDTCTVSSAISLFIWTEISKPLLDGKMRRPMATDGHQLKLQVSITSEVTRNWRTHR